MIIVRLKGGLGNQMFQYAMGRAMAQRHNGSPIYLDNTLLMVRRPQPMGYIRRNYELNDFNIKGELLPLAAIAADCDYITTITEVRRGFHPAVLDHSSPGPLVLDGFWTNEHYFSEVKDIIRADFTF